MLRKQLYQLITVLDEKADLSDADLNLITDGEWNFITVPPVTSADEANLYRAAAGFLRKKAKVASGSNEWLVWFKSPQGSLHACLVARLMEWRD